MYSTVCTVLSRRRVEGVRGGKKIKREETEKKGESGRRKREKGRRTERESEEF
jgi:hypothetical protein